MKNTLNRKYSVEAEFLGNVRTPTHKSYKTLDLVPRLPRDDFYDIIKITAIRAPVTKVTFFQERWIITNFTIWNLHFLRVS